MPIRHVDEALSPIIGDGRAGAAADHRRRRHAESCVGSLIISLPMQLTMPVMCIMPFDQLGLAADALKAQHEVELDRNVLA
ncbi:hypothetical protein [Bradyrhizobium sp. DASA03007]|uniref:hypothetical protein n=1 Tax=unclassified Bradyrhizobium TaxID=2631580 RepID=UPI003F704209